MPWSSFSECWALSQLFHSPLYFHQEAFQFLFTFCHKGGVIRISEVIDISSGNLDSRFCFFQSSVSHDVLCIEVKEAGWQYAALMYSFPYLEQVCCSMSSSNCCFLTCIYISQEAGQVVWYSHLFKNFPHCHSLVLAPAPPATARSSAVLSFLRLHPSTAFQTLLLTMMATLFLLRDSWPQ